MDEAPLGHRILLYDGFDIFVDKLINRDKQENWRWMPLPQKPRTDTAYQVPALSQLDWTDLTPEEIGIMYIIKNTEPATIDQITSKTVSKRDDVAYIVKRLLKMNYIEKVAGE